MQRNYNIYLLRESKRNYYNTLNEKKICCNKKLWKVVKPLLSNKTVSTEKMTLL